VSNARLIFAHRCVANTNASRASYLACRQMQIWSPEGFIALDFAKRKLTLVQPSAEVRRKGLNPARLAPSTRALLKDELFGRHLELQERECHLGGTDQLTRELQHFVDCIRAGTRPRVSGEDGRAAFALACRVLDSIA